MEVLMSPTKGCRGYESHKRKLEGGLQSLGHVTRAARNETEMPSAEQRLLAMQFFDEACMPKESSDPAKDANPGFFQFILTSHPIVHSYIESVIVLQGHCNRRIHERWALGGFFFKDDGKNKVKGIAL